MSDDAVVAKVDGIILIRGFWMMQVQLVNGWDKGLMRVKKKTMSKSQGNADRVTKDMWVSTRSELTRCGAMNSLPKVF